MSGVRTADEVVLALTCSDIHLSHKAPAARSVEECWYRAQRRPLGQLATLRDEITDKQGFAPVVVYAGDVFDRPNPPPQLVNFALDHLPQGYAVPGQHDLLHHSLKDIKKSAFWTLVKARKLTYLAPGRPVECGEPGRRVRLHGFPWGKPLKPCRDPNALLVEVAVVHAYWWLDYTTKHPQAEESTHLTASRRQKLLGGYDAVVIGDNHTSWWKDDFVLNHGCFIRRKLDEREHRPLIGLVCERKGKVTVRRHHLDTEADCFADPKDVTEEAPDFGDFLAELSSLTDAPVNFTEAVRALLSKGELGERARDYILRAMGDETEPR